MDLTERKISGERLYKGRIVDVELDRVTLPDGREANREVVRHPGGVAILPLDDRGRVLMVRQFRYVFGKVLMEIPAGKLERGEDPREAALRELKEETGCVPGEFLSLGAIYASPGVYSEVLHLYLARDLTQEEACPDEGEFVEPEWVPLEQLVEEILEDRIHDAKTVAGVLKLRAFLEREEKEGKPRG